MITATTRDVQPAPVDPTTAIVARMADKMRLMGHNGIAATADTLAEHSDFTRSEIQRYGAAAADLAKEIDAKAR